jgi:hypothetical protein
MVSPVWWIENKEAPMSNVLGPNETLRQNGSLVSANQAYELRMQGDGNLVLYRKEDGKALWNAWESNRWLVPGERPQVAELKMDKDGNLVIYSQGRAMWDTDTHGPHYTTCLVLQDDGNLVICRLGPAVWSTGTA